MKHTCWTQFIFALESLWDTSFLMRQCASVRHSVGHVPPLHVHVVSSGSSWKKQTREGIGWVDQGYDELWVEEGWTSATLWLYTAWTFLSLALPYTKDNTGPWLLWTKGISSGLPLLRCLYQHLCQSRMNLSPCILGLVFTAELTWDLTQMPPPRSQASST